MSLKASAEVVMVAKHTSYGAIQHRLEPSLTLREFVQHLESSRDLRNYIVAKYMYIASYLCA
jgi:hypothetical protein